ncbi:unnamed protein product [Miscanthus lutarioriparius]|uniref:Kinetochore protein SPC25 n=1 Tax=Miscanthus lutarioriparius TaxID=422564 RepID=A0A811NMU4_9POAL|nr:unnamed protein product [Miscanthus lutarioriparius]
MADAAADLRRRIKEKRATIERQITGSRDSAAAASSAFNAALLEARSIANQTRTKTTPPEIRIRSSTVQTSRRSKHKLMTESISNTTATNEQLRRLVMDRRATRDECMNAISNQLKDIESLEAESDADGDKNLENALMWYDKFLGFQVVGEEGVKFVFNKIDVQSPDKEYSFCVKLVEERYILVRCVPFVDGTEELVKDLNCNNDLYKFVRVMRNRFQAATISGNLLSSSFCPDVLSITSSSFSALSLDSRSENSIDRSRTQGQSKNQEFPLKGIAKSSPHTMLIVSTFYIHPSPMYS